ncbi:MAG: tetratricopeptide repeat protein [Xanthomonadales bacterium]|nr:tetratricopeptide repeat protein [Xanthomonadales bacterium]
MKKLFKELKRRNVFKVGIAYLVSAWILLQATEVISEILELPAWAPKLILLILAVGFVPALIIAWAFELTPEGLKLEKEVAEERSITKRTGRKLDYVIMVLLGLSLAYFIWEARFEQKTAEYESAISQPAPVSHGADAQPAEPMRKVPRTRAEVNQNSIAVLPFTNRSANDEDIYFTDGIHDDLLTQLSRIDAFSVISRTSVMEYRDTAKNLKEIAEELDVANIMEGAVQRAGNRVRINVQLIDARTDEHLWAEIYDRELSTENLFDIQSEIAQNIAQALQATLTDTEISTMAKPPTENLEAYDLYLQARQFSLGETRIGYQTAKELFRAAIELDPQFTLAWIGLGKAHITNYWIYGGDTADRDAARAAIDRAKELDPTVPELYMAEGFYWYWAHLDYERALYNLERAIALMPRNEEAHMWHGWASRRDGQWEQAIASFERALEINPRIHFNWVEYGLTLMYLKQFAKAEVAIERAVALDPNHFWTKDMQARYAMVRGDFDAAIRYSTGAQHSGESGFEITFLDARIVGGALEEALLAARNLDSDLEVARQYILLRESWTAMIQWFMGERQAALETARAGMFRLGAMRQQLGEDYRILQAEASLSPILGESADRVRERVATARQAEPEDAVEYFRNEYVRARALAMAGLAVDAAEAIDRVLGGPNEVSVVYIEADPAFGPVHDDPAFEAILNRYR